MRGFILICCLVIVGATFFAKEPTQISGGQASIITSASQIPANATIADLNKIAAQNKHKVREIQAAAERERIADAQRDVRLHLRDPQSAIFGNATVSKTDQVCGYVNARNGFGGFTGQKPYIAGWAKNAVLFSDENPTAFAQLWEKHCRRS